MPRNGYSWGSGSAGQLGHGDEEDIDLPKILEEFGAVTTLATGGCHSAAITENGKMYIWGEGQKFQLGLGSTDNATSPKEISIVPNEKVNQVACGWWHTLVVLENNQVYSFGHGGYGQLGNPQQDLEDGKYQSKPKIIRKLRGLLVISIACGWKQSLIATSTGQVYSWGTGRHGELGHGKEILVHHEPLRVDSLLEHSVVQVYCGWQHSACLSKNGKLFTWGSNKHGQLGREEDSRYPYPKECNMLSFTLEKCASGWHHMVALTTCGKIYSWGKGDHGQLGHGNWQSLQDPKEIKAFQGILVEQIICGSEHSLAVSDSGELYSWGWGEHGNLGHGTKDNVFLPQKIDYFVQQQVTLDHVVSGGAAVFALGNIR